MRFGRYYEDFIEGEIIKHFLSKTITECDNNLFCLLTMNHHPLHLDVEYSKSTEFKKRVVVGTYVASLVIGMTVQDISGKAIANLHFDVNHLKPTYIGDTITSTTKIISTKESESRMDSGLVSVETIGFNQRKEEVIIIKRTILVHKKSGDLE